MHHSQTLISKTGNVRKALLDLMGSIERIDILYSGTPNWDELITGGRRLLTVPSLPPQPV